MARRGKATQRDEDSPKGPYLRRKSPVPVQRALLGARRPWTRGLLLALGAIGLGLLAAYAIDSYLRFGTPFVLAEDGAGLHVTGSRLLSAHSVKEIFQADLGGSILEVPLEERTQQLENLSWVGHAAILRMWPDRVWVRIRERQPVAFVRLKASKSRRAQPRLIDREGVFLDPPPGASFSLPVVTGISASMSLPNRLQRIALFESLVSDLDREEPRYSSFVSEVDVSDPQNARVTTIHEGDVIELQMGQRLFRHRWEVFLSYVDTWKKQYGRVNSVDLRYRGQVAVR